MITSLKARISNASLDGEKIYEVAFIFCFTLSFLQTSMFTVFFPNNFLHYLSMLGIALVLFKVFFLDRQAPKSFILNLLVLALLALTWRTSKDFTVLMMGIFIIGAKNVNFNIIIRDYLVIGMITLIVILLSAKLGIITDLIYHRVGTNVVRQSFGIVYPTDFAAHVVFLILAYVYLNFAKISLPEYVAMALVAWLLFKLCNARFSTIALLVAIPIIIIGQRARQDKIISKFLASFYWTVPVLLAYITQALTYFFNPNKHNFIRINNALSGRLQYGHIGYEKYGFSLFGQHIIEHGWGGAAGLRMSKLQNGNYFFIDSSFIKSPILYGVVITLLLVLILTITSWRSVVNRDFALASVIVIVSLSAVVEQHLFDLSYDPFLLAIFANVYGTSQVKKENNLEKIHS